MKFDLFVLPFTIGLAFVLLASVFLFSRWIIALNASDKWKLVRGIFSIKIFAVVGEVITESLLHRRIFKVNPRLGFMHMSLATGWFLLIVIGNFESRYYSEIPVNPPYYPIFFKFFHHYKAVTTTGMFYTFMLDFLLLLILIGLGFAIAKRLNPARVKMKRTTVQQPFDKIALTALWWIFPLRLLAESFTSGMYHHGGFMTNSLGTLFSMFLPLESLSYAAWWGYSLALFAFFVAVPFSRYMHIPAEILLIAFRRFGLNSAGQKGPFTDLEVHSCPRCGICIDACQIVSDANVVETASVYFLHSVRNNKSQREIIYNCLQCGRCASYCPVQIDTHGIRLAERFSKYNISEATFSYIPIQPAEKAEVVYFAGCMSHLTPSVKTSMVKIMEKSHENFTLLDENQTICCGRPLMLSGKLTEARALIAKNKELIARTGAKKLVTSCPICFKVFREEYSLEMEVLHHSQYLLQLAQEKKIAFQSSGLFVVYHDPCDLGRGSGVYDEPRELLSTFLTLQNIENQREKSLCCGGSLGNFQLSQQQRDKISKSTVKQLLNSGAGVIATSCPLCKKTLQGASHTAIVKDISELVLDTLLTEGDNGKMVIDSTINVNVVAG